jgi:AraC-like DNA-binding protein
MMTATDKPLSQIALGCGLGDQANFSRLFRRIVGASPSVWRRQWGGYETLHPRSRSLQAADRPHLVDERMRIS